jgi:Flp pilus assembly protein TadD
MGDHERFIKHAREALSRGDRDAAALSLRVVVCLEPGRAAGNFNLGVLHARAAETDAAERFYRRTLTIDPGHEGATGNLADMLLALGRVMDAERVCGRATSRAPLSARILGNLALVRVRLGNAGQAKIDVRRAACAEPGYGQAWRVMGMLYHDVSEIADDAYQRAWWSGLRDPSILSNRGEIAQRDGRITDAINLYRMALDIAPEEPDIRANLATANVDDGDFEAARDNARQVLSTTPDHRTARWISSWVSLANRDFENGFRFYDDPWRSPDRDASPYAKAFSLWNGGGVEGALLLWCGQGLGDEILYAGMVDDVLKLGLSVVLETDARLVPLFQRTWPTVRVFARGGEVPIDVVAQSSILRLPMLFRREMEAFPTRSSYLVADPEKVALYRDLYRGFGKGPSVGLSWRSGNQRTGSAKSTHLVEWDALLGIKNVNFVSLQYDDGGEADPRLRLNPGLDVKNDLDDLAAQIAALGHIVSISGVTAHLAGALGTPGQVLLPPAPLWFWFADGADCPWYPALKLHRRARGETWEAPIEAAADAVRTLVTS